MTNRFAQNVRKIKIIQFVLKRENIKIFLAVIFAVIANINKKLKYRSKERI